MSYAILVILKPTFAKDPEAISRLFDAVERKLGVSLASLGIGLLGLIPMIRQAHDHGEELRLRLWVEDGRVRSERA